MIIFIAFFSLRQVDGANHRPAAFMAAALIVVVWGFTGPIFKFSDK